MADVDTRAVEMYERCADAFTDVDELTKDMLRSYCLLSVQLDDINQLLADEGMLIESPKGMKENPAVNVMHKLNADKARYYTPLKRILAQQKGDSGIEDLEAFTGL